MLAHYLPAFVLRRLATMDWSTEARAAVAKWAHELQKGIVFTRRHGTPVEDIVALISDGGSHAGLLPRSIAIERLGELPQSAEWIEILSQPAPTGWLWLVVTEDEGTGAIVEPRRPDALAAMPA